MVNKKDKKRLVILDAHAIIHRAYHALPDFTSDTGEPTGALYGISSMLMKLIADLKPDYLVAAYDLPEPTERHKVFAEYKEGRKKADEALVHQIIRSKDIMNAFAIPIYEKPGFEADDIIGTIAHKLKDNDEVEIVIASGDMDTLQLADKKRVQIFTLRRGITDTITYDEKAVEERFGFSADLVPDYKGLRGDPSDNIPGIKGFGEKRATELIKTFGSIDDIYAALKKDKAAFQKRSGLTDRLVALLEDNEKEARFSRELAEIRRDADIAFSLSKQSWRASLDTSAVLALFSELGFKSLKDRAIKLFDINEEQVEETYEADDPEKDDEKAIRRTAIMLWVLNSEYTNATYDDILQYAKKHTLADARDYILDELKKQKLLHVFLEIEEPLISVIARMEEVGIAIDISHLAALSEKYRKELAKIETRIYKHAEGEFNINSPSQLADVLFDKLGLVSKAQTSTGKRSTREAALQKLHGEHPIIEDILEYREIQKLLSTYIDVLPSHVSPKDDRLHATFLQHGTTTGRMSSQNPNLQNIPTRSERGRAIRKGFVAEKGNRLVTLDYSQVELRMAAGLSGDEAMTSVFKEGGDIHTAVAESVFGTSDRDARRKAKVINFGILYGMGRNALARTLGTSTKEAQSYLDAYFKRHKTLAAYLEDTKAFAKKNGYTETLFGRRRYFPGLASHLPYVKAEAERQAANAPLQGTAADIIKLAMVEADEWLEKKKLRTKARLVLQVHDELVYEVEEKIVDDLLPDIKRIMENVVAPEKLGGVPLSVDTAVGKNWSELEHR